MRFTHLTWFWLFLGFGCNGATPEADDEERSSEPEPEEAPEEETTEGLDCDADWENHGSDTCTPREIRCGQTITARIGDGESFFDDEIYVAKFCGTHDDYRGAEAVYTLLLDERTEANLTLNTPCADLDLVALRWEESNQCPQISDRITTCEMDQRRTPREIKIVTIDRPERHLIVVDGPSGVDGVFQLSVDCP